MAAFRAGSRWLVRVRGPAGTRLPWRPGPGWFFGVQMIASARWRG